MITLAYILSGLSLLMSVLLLIDPKYPLGLYMLMPKLFAGALSAIWGVMGVVGAVLGGIYGAFWAVPMGIVGAGMVIEYVRRCTQGHNGFENAFGTGWSDKIQPEQTRHMIQKRWTPRLKMNASPAPIWERDIPFWMIPGTDRQLLCDLWRPANGYISGLAFIYFHGGGWSLGDKDFLTRPFFHHLVQQGHTVMDVAYRISPETDIYGMIGDVKHANAWLKSNASDYGVDPDKIVLGGGSAGGHLALLAGYAPEHPELTPEDIKDFDLSVCGVISYYGPSDLIVIYQHTKQQRLVDLPPVSIGPDATLSVRGPADWRMDVLMGGHLQDAFDTYQLASPITHVHPGCPPTLLIQPEHDYGYPLDASNVLYNNLVESGVPAINVVIPWTAHAFDLILPQISPPAQSALYDVDRFLALLINNC